MISDKITIITVNFNTSDFVELMVEGLHKLSESRYRILICDNGSSDEHVLRLVELQKRFENIEFIFREQSQAGSIGHAEAVTLLASKVKTPYFLLMDADCVIFQKDWDKVMLSKLLDKVKVFGTPRLLQNGETLDDFPTVFSTLYETGSYQGLNCDFMPGPKGPTGGQDTGYLIAERFREHGLTYKNLVAKNTRQYKDGPFGDMLCAEYYLDEECKQLFSCHFSRGSSSGKDKYKAGLLLKLPFIKKIIKAYLGNRDRKLWIQRGYELLKKSV